MPAPAVVDGVRERLGDRSEDGGADAVGGVELGAGHRTAGGEREERRQQDRGGVHGHRGSGVVPVQGMRGGAVDQGGVGGSESARRAPHGRRPGLCDDVGRRLVLDPVAHQHGRRSAEPGDGDPDGVDRQAAQGRPGGGLGAAVPPADEVDRGLRGRADLLRRGGGDAHGCPLGGGPRGRPAARGDQSRSSGRRAVRGSHPAESELVAEALRARAAAGQTGHGARGHQPGRPAREHACRSVFSPAQGRAARGVGRCRASKPYAVAGGRSWVSGRRRGHRWPVVEGRP
ncbi:hypothetical protein SHIRM173S_00816 [Streptomyces hirsutus]